MRYPRGRGWVTVAVSDSRAIAINEAAHAYRDLENEHGQTPTQVRVVSAERLWREGGPHAVAAAAADVVDRAAATSAASSRG